MNGWLWVTLNRVGDQGDTMSKDQKNKCEVPVETVDNNVYIIDTVSRSHINDKYIIWLQWERLPNRSSLRSVK